jgi:hypothetical protein
MEPRYLGTEDSRLGSYIGANYEPPGDDNIYNFSEAIFINDWQVNLTRRKCPEHVRQRVGRSQSDSPDFLAAVHGHFRLFTLGEYCQLQDSMKSPSQLSIKYLDLLGAAAVGPALTRVCVNLPLIFCSPAIAIDVVRISKTFLTPFLSPSKASSNRHNAH